MMKIHKLTIPNSELFDITHYNQYGFYQVECGYDYTPIILNNTINLSQITFTQLETEKFLEYVNETDNKPADTPNSDISDKEYTLKLVDKLSKFVK